MLELLPAAAPGSIVIGGWASWLHRRDLRHPGVADAARAARRRRGGHGDAAAA